MKNYPINQFEIVESVRFLGNILETPAISEQSKAKVSALVDELITELVEVTKKTPEEPRIHRV